MKKFNLNDLKSDNPDIKYHCAKQCISISEKSPKKLYPKLSTFVKLLDGKNNILKWVSTIVIGNLSAIDSKGKITKLIPRLQQFIKDSSLVTAGNAVKALGKIAQHKKQLRRKILNSILVAEKVTYYSKGKPSPECRNVMIGHVINVLANFTNELKGNKTVTGFLKRQTRNRRPTVKKSAFNILERLKTK